MGYCKCWTCWANPFCIDLHNLNISTISSWYEELFVIYNCHLNHNPTVTLFNFTVFFFPSQVLMNRKWNKLGRKNLKWVSSWQHRTACSTHEKQTTIQTWKSKFPSQNQNLKSWPVFYSKIFSMSKISIQKERSSTEVSQCSKIAHYIVDFSKMLSVTFFVF